jgi:hypothetical protein
MKMSRKQAANLLPINSDYWRAKKRFMAVSREAISLFDNSAILFLMQLLSALIIWSVMALLLLPFTVTTASPGYTQGAQW